jgi:hypothetical protein
MEDTKMTPID